MSQSRSGVLTTEQQFSVVLKPVDRSKFRECTSDEFHKITHTYDFYDVRRAFFGNYDYVRDFYDDEQTLFAFYTEPLTLSAPHRCFVLRDYVPEMDRIRAEALGE